MISAIVTAVIFLYPYEPKQPPKADDTGFTQQGIQEVINANNQFAFDLYNQLINDPKNKGKNIFYSPYSIFSALALVYEGAEGKTAEEIKSVFHFPENSVLRPNFAAIYNEINERNKDYELRTGNALWVQKDYNLLEDYKSRVEKYYGGKATNLDFVNEREKSIQTINSFIEEQTNDKIKDIIKDLSPLTRLIITNAIYFKGSWEKEFNKEYTKEQDFKITPENIVKVPMMYRKGGYLNYFETEKMQILELPYKGDKISMLILLPKQYEEYDYERKEKIVYNYTLEDIEFSLEKLNEYKSQMKKTDIDSIYLPKFEFETEYHMEETMKSLGMITAFSYNADFSGMRKEKDLFIDFIIHKAYVKVNEEGTEAAAATTVRKMGSSAYPLRKIFRADHPFIFIIQQKDTGNILFIGRVIDPTKK